MMKERMVIIRRSRFGQNRFLKCGYILLLLLMIWAFLMPLMVLWNLWESHWVIRVYYALGAALFVCTGGAAVAALPLGIRTLIHSANTADRAERIRGVLFLFMPALYGLIIYELLWRR